MSASGRRSRRVTIQDVSRHAQVSATTVSHALNGRGRVGAETRARIQKVADELGYTANPVAQALKSGRTKTLLAEFPGTAEVPGLESSFLRDVLIGAAEGAIRAGYLLAIAGRSSAHAGAMRPIDGALVVDPVANDPVLERAVQEGMPVVTVSRAPEQSERVSAVDSDYAEGMRSILGHILEMGYEAPALVATREPFAFATTCLEVYEDWMSEHGKRSQVAYATGYPSIEGGRRAVRSLLRRKLVPDAMVALTEPLAVGALRSLIEAGRRIPDDVGLACINDSERLKSATVPVTALDVHAADIGRRAVELLIDLLEVRGRPEALVELPTELHPRASTARRR